MDLEKASDVTFSANKIRTFFLSFDLCLFLVRKSTLVNEMINITSHSFKNFFSTSVFRILSVAQVFQYDERLRRRNSNK